VHAAHVPGLPRTFRLEPASVRSELARLGSGLMERYGD
jgi:hypothetical protein